MSKKQCCKLTRKGLPCKGAGSWYALTYKYEHLGLKSGLEIFCGIHVGGRIKFKTLEEAQTELLRRKL